MSPAGRGRGARLPVVLVLLVLLLVLAPLAHVTPIDPTWLAGYYDEGDHDDVILAAITGVGVAAVVTATVVRLLSILTLPAPPPALAPTSDRPSPGPARAPPGP
jgi:hypothetical protein